MSIDDFLLERIVNESIPEVVGQSVGKIFEPSPLEFAISLKRSDGISLFFSLLPARPGFFLTDRSHKFLETDRSAGYFVNLLRKHLSTSKIVSIEKEPLERRFQVLFSGFDSAGEALKLSLLVELTGRSANAHLFVADAHLASLRETADREQSLIFNPKTRYIPSQQEFESKVENEGVLAATRYYLHSPILAREMEARAKESSPYSAFISLLSDLERSSVKARLYSPSGLQDSKIGLIDPKANLLVSFFPLKLGEGLVEDRFPTLNSAVDRYFQILASVESFQNRKRSLVAKAKAEVLRLDTLLEKLATQRQEFTESSLYKETGELILANLSTLYREDNKLYLINYFHPDQIETSIGIESNETPQQAAERFFKLYQRGKRGLEAVEKRIKEVQREAKSRRSHLENILAIVSKSQLDELDPQKPKNKKAQPISGIRRYISSDGFEILVGRSDAGNDQLTFKIAKAADIWLHAADYPGSHVLIVNPERKEIPQKTIYEGAQLAAFFSKAKGEKSAAVRYTERKNISRPKNAKPGLALLLKFKTILVPPFESGNRLL